MYRTLRITAGAFFLIAASAMLPGAAMAGCSGQKIEVTYAGSKICVHRKQFAALSESVQATADREDLAEAFREVLQHQSSAASQAWQGGEGGSSNSSAGGSFANEDSGGGEGQGATIQ